MATDELPSQPLASKRRSPKSPTPLQLRFLAALPTANSVKEAMRTAGYATSTTTKQVAGTKTSPVFQRALLKTYDRAGISDDLLAQRAREGLDATYESRWKNVEKPDPKTRATYLRLIHEVRQDLEPEGSGHQSITVQIGFKNSWPPPTPETPPT